MMLVTASGTGKSSCMVTAERILPWYLGAVM
jgi:hypothetical protein